MGLLTRIGGLFVGLSSSAKQFNDEMASAKKGVKKNVGDMTRVFGVFNGGTKKLTSSLGGMRKSILAAAAPAALGVLIKKSLETASAIVHASDKIGIETGMLQELRFAAEKVGLEHRTLDMSMQRFSRRVGEAQMGVGELRGTLEQYNIAVRDSEGRTRSIDDIFNDLADTIAGAESEQEQLRIAFKAFDSEGAAFVQVLKQGSEEISRTRKEARDLGVVIEDSLLRNAESADTQMGVLSRTLSSQLTTAVISIAPQIEDLTNKFIEGLPTLTEWIKEIGLWTGAIKATESEKVIHDIDEQIASLQKNIEKFTESDFKKAAREFLGGTDTWTPRIEEARKAIQELEEDKRILIQLTENEAQANREKVREEIDAENTRQAAVRKRLKDIKEKQDAEKKANDDKKRSDEQAAKDEIKLAKDTADAKKKIVDEFNTTFEKMTTDQFELQRQALDKHVEEWIESGVSKTDAERVEAEMREEIALSELEAKLNAVAEFARVIGQIGDELLDSELTRINEDKTAKTNAAIEIFEIKKAALIKENTVDGQLTKDGLKQIEALEQAHQSRLDQINDQAIDAEKKAAEALRPIRIFEAIINTAAAVTAHLENPFLAVATGILGAIQIHKIATQKFAKGDVFGSDTFFSFNKGRNIGEMGENGKEAIMPLERTADGSLGVKASGGGVGVVHNHFHLNIPGIATEETIDEVIMPRLETLARQERTKLLARQSL